MTPSTHDFDAAACAALLMQAWTSGHQLDALPPPARPRDLAEGYAAQARLFDATGDTLAGWKLGVGSPAQLRAAKLERALVGRMGQRRVHRDGAHIRLPDAAPATIECEIGFVLAHDVAPDAQPVDLPALIDSTHVTFEVVRSRFVDRRAVGWPSFAADNVGFEALVVSDALQVPTLQSIYDTMQVTVDGQPATPLQTGDDAIDAHAGLRALIEHARQHGIRLRRGQIVSTGTMTRPFDLVGAPHEVCARFMDRTLRFSL